MVKKDYKIDMSPHAKFDLLNITSYITYDLYSPQAAKRLQSKIQDSISILQYSPLIARSRISKNFYISIRMLPVKNYLIFYSVSYKTVTIHRIIHSRQNIR